MTTTEIEKIINSGIKPLVRLNGELWDEGFGDKGMIARITSFVHKDHDLAI